jgi:hypothetical protein
MLPRVRRIANFYGRNGGAWLARERSKLGEKRINPTIQNAGKLNEKSG